MNQFELLADNDAAAENEPAQKDSEHFKFTSIVPDAKITLQQEGQGGRLDPARYPAEATLLACSSKFGYFVAGTPEGFVFGSTKSILKIFKTSEKGGMNILEDKVSIKIDKGAVHHLRLNADERQIIVAIEGGHVLIYDAKDVFQQRENAQPKTSFQLAADILELRPNPDALPHIAAVRLKNNQSIFIDITTGSTIATIPRDDVTAMSWSPKGKQIVCGRRNGILEHFDAQGQVKDSIEMPKSLDDPESRFVLSVLWIENHIFLAVYSKIRESEDDMYFHDPYIIDRKPKNSNEIRYMLMDEVTPVYNSDNRGSHMYIECIRHFSPEVPYVIILADNATSDVSVIGQDETGEWATWLLPEGSMITMPLSEETNLDTFPKGLAIDYSVSEELPPYDPAESTEGVKPVPMLIYLNDEDHIGAQYCYNEALAKKGEKYQGMVEAQDLLATQTEEPKQPAARPTVQTKPEAPSAPAFGAPTASTATPATSSFANSPFGSAINQSSSSFSDLLSGNTQETKPAQTGFGASATGFGAGTGSSGFSFASLAKNTTPGAKVPSFGMKPAAAQTGTTPTFGSTTAFGAAAGAPVFGSTTSFGAAAGKLASSPFGAATAKTDSAPTFGSTTSFGALAQQQAGKSFGDLLSGTAESKPTETTTTTSTTGFKPSSGLSFASLAKNTAPGAVAPSSGLKPAAPAGTTPTFGTTSFGTAPPAAATTEEKDTETKPATLFGATPVKTEEPVSTAPATAGFSFGQAKPEVKTEETAAKPSTGFTFGQPAEQKKGTTMVKAEEPETQKKEEKAPTETAKPSATTAATSFSFGDAAKQKTETKPAAPTFSFGGATQQKGESKPAVTGFSFGAATQPKTETKPATTGFSFGAATQQKPEIKPSTTSFSFEATPQEKAEEATSKPTSTGFSFGAAPKASEASPKTSTTTTTEKSTGFSFGSFDANLPKVTPTAPAKPSTTSASTGFSFAPPTAKPEPTTKEPAKPTSPAPSAPATTLQAGAKPKTEEKKPLRKPTEKEGMAREFEVAYLSVLEQFDKLEEKYKYISSLVRNQTSQQISPKTREDLEKAGDSWKVGDARSLGDLLDGIISDARKMGPKFQNIKQSIRYLEEDLLKLKAKIEDVKQYSQEGKEQDSVLKKMLQERQVDEDSQEKWMRAEARSVACEKQLETLERRVHEFKKKLRMQPIEEDGFPSLYAMYRTLCDIEAELGTKQDSLREMEEKLAELRLSQNRAKALKSTSGFRADDEEEEEPKVITQKASNVTVEAPWTELAFKQSADQFQRAVFLDKLCSTRRKIIKQTIGA